MLSSVARRLFGVVADNARCLSSLAKPQISEVERHDETRCLLVKWNDGTTGTYAYPWLVDNSQYSYSAGSRNKARKLLMNDLNTSEIPSHISLGEDGQSMQIEWPSDESPHTFDADWLRDRNVGDPNFRQKRKYFLIEQHETWSSGDFKKRIPADYELMMTNEKYMRDRLHEFMKYGIMHVQNAPARPNVLAEIGERCGYLYNGHHGKTGNSGIFEVVVEIDPCNLMNTPRTLGLHTDFPQYQQPPEIQILHVIEQAGSGGENQFCDGFRVARQMEKEQPDLFQLLVKYPIEYIDWGEYSYKYQHVARWRPIEFDKDGRLYGIFFNNQVRSWFYDAPAEVIPRLYDALKTFNEYCYQERNMVELKMMPGEMMWFANNRVLHGRSAFQLDGETKPITRHLEGAYLSFDVIRSKIRVITENLRENTHASL